MGFRFPSKAQPLLNPAWDLLQFKDVNRVKWSDLQRAHGLALSAMLARFCQTHDQRAWRDLIRGGMITSVSVCARFFFTQFKSAFRGWQPRRHAY